MEIVRTLTYSGELLEGGLEAFFSIVSAAFVDGSLGRLGGF
jgi:hypothetical protein